MPVRRESVDAGVLAHGGDGDAVSERDFADGKRGEKMWFFGSSVHRFVVCENRFMVTRVLTLAICLLLGVAFAAEPLVGTWKLESQEMNGAKSNFDPLTLRIGQKGETLAFAFSVPINNVHYLSISYLVRLDGTEGDVKNGQGEKLGTIKMVKAGAGRYKFTLSGANRPLSSGTLTVSPDGKHLTSESNGLLQVFAHP